MSTKKDIDKINFEIKSLNSELEKVLSSLEEMKLKHNKNKLVKEEALKFIDKTEKIIQLAEIGKMNLTPEEKEKLKKALFNIIKIFK